MRYTIQVTVTVDADSQHKAYATVDRIVRTGAQLHGLTLPKLDAEVIAEAPEPTEDEAWDALNADKLQAQIRSTK